MLCIKSSFKHLTIHNYAQSKIFFFLKYNQFYTCAYNGAITLPCMEVIPSQTHKFWYVPDKIHNIHWHLYTQTYFPTALRKRLRAISSCSVNIKYTRIHRLSAGPLAGIIHKSEDDRYHNNKQADQYQGNLASVRHGGLHRKSRVVVRFK